MKTDNIVAAPQIADVNAFYTEWLRNHVGGIEVFYEFMTTPGSERDKFLADMGAVTEFSGSVLTATLKK